MSTALSIKGKTQANEAVTSTINYVNPDATKEQLISLATAFNDMTTNTVTDITKIDKNSLINTIDKLPRNLALSPATVSAAEIPTDATEAVGVTLTGDGGFLYPDLTVKKLSGAIAIFLDLNNVQTAEGRYPVIKIAKGNGKTSSFPGEIEFSVPEDGNYQSEAVTLTIGE